MEPLVVDDDKMEVGFEVCVLILVAGFTLEIICIVMNIMDELVDNSYV